MQTHSSLERVDMTEPAVEDGTLAHHLARLAATADDLSAFLTQSHEEGGIHPEALAKAEHLSTSLKDVILSLTHHEHLAMSSDDVWKALTVKHQERCDGTLA